jgi:dienelactone hydrolase
VKKFLKIAALIIVTVPLLMLGYLTYSNQKNLARPTALALSALESTDTLSIKEDGNFLIMRPTGMTPTTGVIVYPGANCDVRGYAPVTRAMAEAGYLVISVSMPFDFSIFAPNRADAVQAAFPEIDNWVIVGHSMGGAMAGQYAFDNQDKLAGLIFWDSYPPEYSDLSDATLPVVSIHRATLEGKGPEKFQAQEYLFPPDTMWVPVPGGNHMQFGSFDGGGYVETMEAKIGPDAQHQIILAATLEGLSRMQ